MPNNTGPKGRCRSSLSAVSRHFAFCGLNCTAATIMKNPMIVKTTPSAPYPSLLIFPSRTSPRSRPATHPRVTATTMAMRIQALLIDRGKPFSALRISTKRYTKRYPGVTYDCAIASGPAASHTTKSEPSLILPQPTGGTGVRAELRRGVSCETTTPKGFPVEDQPQVLHLTLCITFCGYS